MKTIFQVYLDQNDNLCLSINCEHLDAYVEKAGAKKARSMFFKILSETAKRLEARFGSNVVPLPPTPDNVNE